MVIYGARQIPVALINPGPTELSGRCQSCEAQYLPPVVRGLGGA